MHADVLVVGAGPAGIATAIAAGLKGLRVTVAESRRPPIDKPCGEGLLPEAVASLRHLGIDLASCPSAMPFAGIRFSDLHSSAGAALAVGTAFGMRRAALHRLLLDRATEVGVAFRWGVRVSDFSSSGVRIDGTPFQCKWLVGADGQHSAVRRWAGLEARRARRFRLGLRRHYAVRPWTDHVEVYWGDRCQFVVTPVGPGEICASFFSSDSHLRIHRALTQFPRLEARLAGARPLTTEQGTGMSLGKSRAVVRGHVALVGDASCTVDGIAGQGMSLAFCQAIHLADALAAGNLARYESAHRRIIRVPTLMTRLLLLMDRYPPLRGAVLRLFAAVPALFAGVISLHTGGCLYERLKAKAIVQPGWRILRA